STKDVTFMTNQLTDLGQVVATARDKVLAVRAEGNLVHATGVVGWDRQRRRRGRIGAHQANELVISGKKELTVGTVRQGVNATALGHRQPQLRRTIGYIMDQNLPTIARRGEARAVGA